MRYDPNLNKKIPSVDFPDYSGKGYNDVGVWWQGVASSWPRSTMSTTTPDAVLERARVQEEERRRAEIDGQARWAAENDIEFGTVDREPTAMDFFNGKSYAEGRRLYNEHRAQRGLPPVPEGKR